MINWIKKTWKNMFGDFSTESEKPKEKRRYTRITAEIKSEVIEMKKEGFAPEFIALGLKISRTSVYNILREYNNETKSE